MIITPKISTTSTWRDIAKSAYVEITNETSSEEIYMAYHHAGII